MGSGTRGRIDNYHGDVRSRVSNPFIRNCVAIIH